MVSQPTNTDSDDDLIAAYIAENGAPRVYKTGMRWLVSRCPASYDPQVTFRAVDKRNPHVCARWSDT